MPTMRLKEFLDSHGVKYVTMLHSPAYTAQEVAAATHIPGRDLAKTVMVKLDGQLAMAVLPASYRIDFEQLAQTTNHAQAELASEEEFRGVFPGCEVGAMPPFGNLWGVPVYVAESLASDDRIAFAAGTHAEVMILQFADYKALVEPRILKFSKHS